NPPAPPTRSRPSSATGPGAAAGSPLAAWRAATPSVATGGTPSLTERRTDVRRPLRGLREDAQLLLRPDPQLRGGHRPVDVGGDGGDDPAHPEELAQHDPDAAAPARAPAPAAEVQGRPSEDAGRAH